MEISTYIRQANQENYHELFNREMRDGLSNNGWTVPQQSTANIADLEPMMPNGTLWFDTDLAKLVVKTASGVIEVIQSV